MLSRQFIKRTVILPPDHLATFQSTEFFKAALFFEDLSQRLEFRHAFRPFPFRATEAIFEFSGQPLEVQIVLGEVVDRVIAFCLDPDVVQIRIHRAGDVAGECPWGCGPDEEVFLSCLRFRRAVGRQPSVFVAVASMFVATINTEG